VTTLPSLVVWILAAADVEDLQCAGSNVGAVERFAVGREVVFVPVARSTCVHWMDASQ